MIDKVTKAFKRKGEEFQVSPPDDCLLTVTGKDLTAQVSVKGSHYVIQVIDADDNGQLYSSDCDPVVAACDRILKFSPKSRQKLCDGLSKAFSDL